MNNVTPLTSAKTRTLETEKVTVNLGFVDLGHIDLPEAISLGHAVEDAPKPERAVGQRAVEIEDQEAIAHGGKPAPMMGRGGYTRPGMQSTQLA